MKDYILKSNFKDDISRFLNQKHLIGYKYILGQKLIEQFDAFCFTKYPTEKALTREIAIDWATPRENESASSVANRIIVVRQFAKFLKASYKNAFVIPGNYIPKKPKYNSYIYTDIELQKIFDIIDNQKFRCNHKNSYITFPLLFRIFYCCGLRISEILSLKVKHIDLENGIIAVYESKNNDNRFVVLSDELQNRCKKYYNQMHSNSTEDDYFFYTKNKEKAIVETTLRKSFRQILKLANIEKNKDNNPRIHDFRHTYAVHCLKKFVKENKDLYAYLPILKTYMGHSKFRSTEYYLKLTNDMYPDILEKTNAYINEAIPRIGGAL